MKVASSPFIIPSPIGFSRRHCSTLPISHRKSAGCAVKPSREICSSSTAELIFTFIQGQARGDHSFRSCSPATARRRLESPSPHYSLQPVLFRLSLIKGEQCYFWDGQDSDGRTAKAISRRGWKGDRR